MRRKLESLLQTLGKGCRLLVRSPRLACLSGFVLLILYASPLLAGPTKSKMDIALFLVFPLSLILALVVHPYLRACLTGSYVQVSKTSSVTIREFITHGRRFYTSFLILALLQMAAFIPFFAIIFLFGITPLTDQQPLSWMGLAATIFMIFLVPLHDLAPVTVVLTRQRPLKAVLDSYKLVGRNLVEFMPLLVLFWIVPSVLSLLLDICPENLLCQVSKTLIWVALMVIGVPTMVVYLSEKVETVQSMDTPVERPKWNRLFWVGIALIIIILGLGALVTIQYFMIYSHRSKMVAELKTPGVLVGPDLLSKRLFFEDARLGQVTDIVMGKLDPSAGIEIGITGTQGALFVDEKANVKSSVMFDGRTKHVDIMDVDGDGVFEFVNSGGAWIVEASLIDHNGKTFWTYGGRSGINHMAAGDMDGDGIAEFVVGFNGSGGVHLLDKNGKKKWEQSGRNVWHVELADTEGDGRPEIVHSNAAGQITVRDMQGKIIRQTKPNAVGLKRPPYFSHFSIARWPSKKGSESLLVPDGDALWIIDFQGFKMALLDAPHSNESGEARGIPVRLKSDQPDYFAVTSDLEIWGRCVLYIYEPLPPGISGQLVYQEILPESCGSIAALSLNHSESEALFVGGNGKVWRYDGR